jgi:hypothetical protein
VATATALAAPPSAESIRRIQSDGLMLRGVMGAMIFYLNRLFSWRLLVKKVRSAPIIFFAKSGKSGGGKSATHWFLPTSYLDYEIISFS